jgi:hypothetical protein
VGLPFSKSKGFGLAAALKDGRCLPIHHVETKRDDVYTAKTIPSTDKAKNHLPIQDEKKPLLL